MNEDLTLEDIVDANEMTDKALVDLVRGLMLSAGRYPGSATGSIQTKIGLFRISVRKSPLELDE